MLAIVLDLRRGLGRLRAALPCRGRARPQSDSWRSVSRRCRPPTGTRRTPCSGAGGRLVGERLKGVLQAFGEAVQERSKNTSAVRLRLIQAGYPNAAAVPMYLGLRVAVPALMGMGAAAPASHAGLFRRQDAAHVDLLRVHGLRAALDHGRAGGSRSGRRRCRRPCRTRWTCWSSAWRRGWVSTRRWSGYPKRSTGSARC